MSYPVDLDEMGEERILLELKQRERRRNAGHCDYCDRPPTANVCKFPRRHFDARIMPIGQLKL